MASCDRYVQGTILNMEHLEKAMHGCETVIHLASLKKFLGVSNQLIRSVNVDGTQNVITHVPTIHPPRTQLAAPVVH